MTQSWVREKNGYTNREDPERFRRGLGRTFPFLQQLTVAFQSAGVPLLLGTDVGIPVIVAGTSVHDELEELVAAGLTPEQALATATRNPARFLGLADGGTVEVGKRADLLLLGADPLLDIRNSRSITGVVVAGRFLDVEALDGLLAASARPSQ
jgi:cytosine/adenosine deaminase-related metal-dependent hydrolase